MTELAELIEGAILAHKQVAAPLQGLMQYDYHFINKIAEEILSDDPEAWRKSQIAGYVGTLIAGHAKVKNPKNRKITLGEAKPFLNFENPYFDVDKINADLVGFYASAWYLGKPLTDVMGGDPARAYFSKEALTQRGVPEAIARRIPKGNLYEMTKRKKGFESYGDTTRPEDENEMLAALVPLIISDEGKIVTLEYRTEEIKKKHLERDDQEAADIQDEHLIRAKTYENLTYQITHGVTLQEIVTDKLVAFWDKYSVDVENEWAYELPGANSTE